MPAEAEPAFLDIASGLKTRDGAAQVEASDPLGVIKTLSEAPHQELPTLLVLRNFHRYLGFAEVAAEVAKAVTQGKSSRNFIIVVPPWFSCHQNSSDYSSYRSRPATRSELADLLSGIATGPGEMPTGQHLETSLTRPPA